MCSLDDIKDVYTDCQIATAANIVSDYCERNLIPEDSSIDKVKIFPQDEVRAYLNKLRSKSPELFSSIEKSAGEKFNPDQTIAYLEKLRSDLLLTSSDKSAGENYEIPTDEKCNHNTPYCKNCNVYFDEKIKKNFRKKGVYIKVVPEDGNTSDLWEFPQ